MLTPETWISGVLVRSLSPCQRSGVVYIQGKVNISAGREESLPWEQFSCYGAQKRAYIYGQLSFGEVRLFVVRIFIMFDVSVNSYQGNNDTG